MEAWFDSLGVDAPRAWSAFLLSMPRLAGMTLLLPFLRPPQVPGSIRNALIVSLGLLLAPMVFEGLGRAELTGASLAGLALKEVALGLMMGFIVSLLFYAPQAVGDFIDNQRGASIASLFNPAVGGQSSNMGLLLSQAFLVWFLLSGGFLILLELVFLSFRLYPVGAAFPQITAETVPLLTSAFSAYLKLAFLAAGPVVFSMLIAELSLGLVSRFAPQLNVFFISMSLKSLTAIIVLLFYFGVMLRLLYEENAFFDLARDFLTGLSVGQ